MVVSIAITIGRGSRAAAQSFSRAAGLLAGISSLSVHSGNIPLLPDGHQVPAIEGFAGAPQSHAIDPLPNVKFSLLFAGSNRSLSFGFDSGLDGLPQTQGSDLATAALVNETASASSDEPGVGQGVSADSTPTVTESNPGRNQEVCESLAQHFQVSGEYWNAQATSSRRAQLVVKSLADPTQGSSIDSSNLSQQGSAGAWCRPLPAPFEESSPLASRTFWTPILVLLCGVVVFWLSRGVSLPR